MIGQDKVEGTPTHRSDTLYFAFVEQGQNILGPRSLRSVKWCLEGSDNDWLRKFPKILQLRDWTPALSLFSAQSLLNRRHTQLQKVTAIFTSYFT